jgi:hypothetical protein
MDWCRVFQLLSAWMPGIPCFCSWFCQLPIALKLEDPPPIEQDAGQVEHYREEKPDRHLRAWQADRIKHKYGNDEIND